MLIFLRNWWSVIVAEPFIYSRSMNGSAGWSISPPILVKTKIFNHFILQSIHGLLRIFVMAVVATSFLSVATS